MPADFVALLPRTQRKKVRVSDFRPCFRSERSTSPDQ
jgi:hypothetical protein